MLFFFFLLSLTIHMFRHFCICIFSHLFLNMDLVMIMVRKLLFAKRG